MEFLKCNFSELPEGLQSLLKLNIFLKMLAEVKEYGPAASLELLDMLGPLLEGFLKLKKAERKKEEIKRVHEDQLKSQLGHELGMEKLKALLTAIEAVQKNRPPSNN